MNESIIIQKMISIGQHFEREEIFYSGAEADARALLEEIKQALRIHDVVGQSEQLADKGRYCNDCGDYVGKGCDNSDCKDFKG